MSKLNKDEYKDLLIETVEALDAVREKYLSIKHKITRELPSDNEYTLRINLFDLPFVSCVMNSIITVENLKDQIDEMLRLYVLEEDATTNVEEEHAN